MDVRQRGSGGGVSDAGLATSQKPQRLHRALSDSKIVRGSSKGLASTCLVCIFLAIVVTLGVTGSVVFLSSYDTAQKSSPSVRGMKEQPQAASEDRVDRKLYEALQQKNKALQEQLINFQNHPAADTTAKLSAAGPDQDKLIKTVKRLTQYRSRMHEMIQLISKRNLLYKYGSSPHYVEILLSFDPESNVADADKAEDTDILLIQLAPVDEMPATVFWFLEQVNATLYDGCSFHRNAGHVVQGGPAPNFETLQGGKDVMQKFQQTGLDSVPFQEYSPNFPHVKYSLGYAGRPGGPDFYVSTQDNTRNHGPGGQSSYEDAAEADPCFAKVVPGFEHVVDRMHKSVVKPGDYKHMVHNIAIRHMRLISNEDAAKLIDARSDMGGKE